MSNIDEKAKNFTIEMRIFENYEIIKVIDFLTIRNISHIGLRF